MNAIRRSTRRRFREPRQRTAGSLIILQRFANAVCPTGLLLTYLLCRSNRINALQKIFQGPKADEAKLAIDDYSDAVPPTLIETAAAGHSQVLEILLDA